MKQSILFEGELGGQGLDEVLPELIRKAGEIGQDVFVRWNGATLRVASKDTADSLMKEYKRQLAVMAMANRMEAPREGRDKHLYRIKNKIGEFYIVARSFDEAADEMKERLRRADYGFFQDRNVPSIDHLAVEHFFAGKQSFSDKDANLIIVED